MSIALPQNNSFTQEMFDKVEYMLFSRGNGNIGRYYNNPALLLYNIYAEYYGFKTYPKGWINQMYYQDLIVSVVDI